MYANPQQDDGAGCGASARNRGFTGGWVIGGPVKSAPEPFSRLIVLIGSRRDRGAFSELFSHFAPRVKSYMMRLGLTPDAAEELAQDTLLAVWRKAEGFDPTRASASTWIFTIARNLRIDIARRAGRGGLSEDPTAVESQPPAPDAVVVADQDERRLALAVESLPPEQAEVIRLAYFSDRPHSEIAALLALPLGTVKSRLRLAMARLRAGLETTS